MNKLNDRQKVEAALDEAASISQHGSNRARSGQIDQEIIALQQVAKRLAKEAQGAYQSWANWEAINDLLETDSRAKMAMEHCDMAIGPVRQALARDAMLGAFRLSDPFDKKQKKDSAKITICRLVSYLNDDVNRDWLSSAQWALDLGYKSNVAVWAANQNSERIASLQRTVVERWSNQSPQDTSLLELRTIIRPVRDKILAHAIESEEISHPTIDQIRRLMAVTWKLSSQAEFLFCGHGFSEENFVESIKKQAMSMWRLALEGPIDRLLKDQEQRRKLLDDAAE